MKCGHSKTAEVQTSTSPNVYAGLVTIAPQKHNVSKGLMGPQLQKLNVYAVLTFLTPNLMGP